jgi:hypothetical protein
MCLTSPPSAERRDLTAARGVVALRGVNELIRIRLRRRNKPLRIGRKVPNGIELDEPDPIQRTVYLSFDGANEITLYRMRRTRQIQGWEPHEFRLVSSVEDGAIVLRGVDPNSLPPGRYWIGCRIEEMRIRSARKAVAIEEHGEAILTLDAETDDREVDVDFDACDPLVRQVIEASTIDGRDGRSWLANVTSATKKACLLNILASLRVRPSASEPLVRYVQHVFWVSNDRIYAKVHRQLLETLEALVVDPQRPFYREGRPKAAIHLQLLAALTEPADRFPPACLVSFRGEGKPSLQTVIAEPPTGLAYTYAEFDLDLGNALQDLAGFVVHMGELLDRKPTNHLDLRRDLAKTRAGAFLPYDIA